MKPSISFILLAISIFAHQAMGIDCDKLVERNGWRTLKLGMSPDNAVRELKKLCLPLEGATNTQLIVRDPEMNRTKTVTVSKEKLGGLTAGTSKVGQLSLVFFDDRLCDISIDIGEDGAKDVVSELKQVFGTPDPGDPDHGTYQAWFWTCGSIKMEWLVFRESPFGGKLTFVHQDSYNQWLAYKSSHTKEKVEQGF